jgi:hypothetical protein
LVFGVLGCTTPPLVDRRLETVSRVALVSLHAPRDITVQDATLTPGFLPSGLGAEMIEMIEGDVEHELEVRFGADIVPLVVAEKSPLTASIPAPLAADGWVGPRGVAGVDIDAADVVERLGALARALHVDAVVVVRHEWWLSRVWFSRSIAVYGHDRCTVFVVDHDGVVVWRDTVVAQVASPQITLLPGTAVSGVGIDVDDTRALARRAAREAWRDLLSRGRSARPSPPATPPSNAPSTTTP